MRGEDIYNHIKDFDRTSKIVYLKRLTSEERKEYENYKNARYQAQHREKIGKEAHNENQKNLMKKIRAQDPEYNRKINIEHNRLYREKQRQIKASSTIANNIKIHLSKKKMNVLKEQKAETLKDKIIKYKKKIGRPRLTEEEKQKNKERREQLRGLYRKFKASQ